MFIKYQDIENSYQSKHIQKTLEYHPELKTCKYVATEKLDGSNIQLIFQPGIHCIEKMMEVTEFCSRSNKLNKTSNFQGASIPELLERYKEIIRLLQIYANQFELPVNLYGELYGYGIQKRINYGKDKYLTFFDMRINGHPVSQKDFCDYMHYLEWRTEFKNIYVKPFKIFDSLEEALELSPEFESAFSPTKDHAEGWVIKPWDVASTFYLKIKSEKFKEKTKVREIKNKEYSITVNKLKAYFNGMINENRVLSAFSKIGEIERPDQIGDYVKYVLEDVKKDFLKEYNLEEDLTQEEKKYIFNGGKHVVEILRKYL